MMKPTQKILASILFGLTFMFQAKAAPCAIPPGTPPQKIQATVLNISDGDTVSVNLAKFGKQSIRLLTLDTPELHFPLNGRMYNQGPIAQIATDFLATQIKVGDSVMIEIDAVACDSYGRVLGYIWKGSSNINLSIVANSMAVNYCIAPNLNHCEEFAKVVAQTSRGKVGVFGVPDLEEPYLWRAALRGEGLTKFVADIRTKKVYQPDAVKQIPIAYRVFFMKAEDVKSPYVWAQ